MNIRRGPPRVLLLSLNFVASVALSQPPKPSIYIQAQPSLGAVLATSVAKRHVPVDLVADRADANYVLNVSPIEIKKCKYTCYGVDPYPRLREARLSVKLSERTSGKVVWVYTFRMGTAGSRTEQLLADAVAMHFRSFIRKNGGLAAGSTRLPQTHGLASAFSGQRMQVFLIPDGYRGHAYIVYDVPNGETLEETREQVIYSIPEDGVLRLAATTLPETDSTEYFYERPDGSLLRIPRFFVLQLDHDVAPGCGGCGAEIEASSPHLETFEGPAGCRREVLEFYVDTEDRIFANYQQERLGHYSPDQSVLCPKYPPPETPNSSARTENTASTGPDKSEAPGAVAPPAPHLASYGEASLLSTNFVNSSIADLQQIVPELRGLKPANDQSSLLTLLDKIGDRTVDLSRKIPNLIAREKIVESQPGTKAIREDFSYLILARRNSDAVTLEEFRVDLKTGAMLETDDSRPKPLTTDSSAIWDDLARARQRVNARSWGRPPLSQGFASMWVRFYPSNRSESNFRYLGEQKMGGRHTLVMAFAQKPGSVRLPAEVRYKDGSLPVYYQGTAWVDDSDFRILRLRTDLLSPVPDLSLNQLTAEVQFAEMQVAGLASPLWLPHDVQVTSVINGHTFHDKHSYLNYRSFQVHSKILLTP